MSLSKPPESSISIDSSEASENYEGDYERVKLPLDANIKAKNSLRVFVIRALVDILLDALEIDQMKKDTIRNEVIGSLTEANVVSSQTDSIIFSGVFNQVREYMENCLKQALGDKSQDQCCPISNLALSPVSDLSLKSKMKNSQDNFCSKYKMDFTEICLLGEGGFGNVYKAQKKSNKIPYAIKKILFQNGKSDLEICQREVQQLEVLSHKNIVRYYDSWTEINDINQCAEKSTSEDFEDFEDELSKNEKMLKDFEDFSDGLVGIKLFIQMELCDDTLSKWLVRRNDKKVSGYEPGHNKKMVKQILKGVRYLHEKNIIHRDLKPDNILINHLGNFNFEAKIADFGLSRKFFKSSKEDQGCGEGEGDNKVLTSGVGTRLYASPEQRNGSSYDLKSDIYSVGLMTFEIFWSMGSDSEKSKNFSMLKNSQVIEEFAKEYKNESDFVRLMTKINPDERPTAEQALLNNCLAKSTNLEEALKEQLANAKDELKTMNSRLKVMKSACSCGAGGT